ncbi:hypothetical protein [Microbacterium esteraromaticum]|uniref:hypothetical protein n=1 Tax=Microbacterium esteraromaticum TaxID=57043 RepID=UPI0021BD264C|nr:hypothetical protein [Microbacterium esteraromaticum]
MMTSPAKTAVRLRAAATLTGAGLALAMLAGCSPQPEPTPTETPLFASEEEAFAAAEETYRAYVQAVNDSRLDDSSSFEPVFELLTGSALTAERETTSLYHAEQLSRTGDTTFDSFSPLETDGSRVVANLCIDVSEVELLNAEGQSVVPADRPPRSGREVTFVPGDTSNRLQIASNHRPSSGFTC